jgi:hypothetical protein
MCEGIDLIGDGRHPSLGCWLVALAATLVAAMLVPAGALAAGDANQGSCPASTESSPGFRTYLPDCRAYELVTPPYKEGIATEADAVSADGSHVIVSSNGAFAGTKSAWAAYELTREGAGWVASSLQPPASEFINTGVSTIANGTGMLDAGSNLDATLWKLIPYAFYQEYRELGSGSNNGTTRSGLETLYRRETAADGSARFTEVGPLAPAHVDIESLRYEGGSSGLGHVVLGMNPEAQVAQFIAGDGPLWPGDKTAALNNESFSLYQYDGTDNAEPSLVAVSNEGLLKGSPHVNEGANLIGQCGAELGAGRANYSETRSNSVSAYNAVSADGQSVFFTVLAGVPGSKAGATQCGGGLWRPSMPYLAPYECEKPCPEGSVASKTGYKWIEAEITQGLQNRLNEKAIVDMTAEIGKPFNVACGPSQCNVEFKEALHSGPAVNELYVRIGQSKTLLISEPPLSLPGRECTGVCETDENEPAQHKPAFFQGASQDGSKVFFTTQQPLVNEDGDSANDLYMAQVGCPAGESECEPARKQVTKLVQVSHDPTTGKAAEVQGVARISQHGNRVYFVAKGKLTTGPNAEGREPEEGADNLYMFDGESGHNTFVATLLDETEEKAIEEEEQKEQEKIHEEAANIENEALAKAIAFWEKTCPPVGENFSCIGEVEEVLEKEKRALGYYTVSESVGTRGPSGTLAQDRSVWQEKDERPVQTTPDGHFLMFVSAAHLTGAEDTSKAPQLFEYDAQAQRIVRASIGQNGYNGNGNVSTFAQAPRFSTPSYASAKGDSPAAANGVAISEDGAVFFEGQDALTPQALPGALSVYVFRGGNVYLVSSGRDLTTRVGGMFADPSGQDVFFSTVDALVPQDTDTQVDLYDARIGGGFPGPGPAGCAGEACKGQLGSAPPLPALGGSATTPGGGNLTPLPISKPTAKPRSRPLTRAQKLVKALAACGRKPKRERAACVRQAKKRYAARRNAKKAHRRGK